MAGLEELKAMLDVAHTAVQGELCCLFTANPEASCKRMLEIAAENEVTPTVGVVNVFLKQMDNKRFCMSLNYIFLIN